MLTSSIYYNVSQTLLHIGITRGSSKKYCLAPNPRCSDFIGMEYDLSIRFLKSFLDHFDMPQSLGITVLPTKSSITYFFVLLT